MALEHQCQLCRRAAQALDSDFGYLVPKHYDEHHNRFVQLGSWIELQDNENCPTCQRVVHLFREKLKDDPGHYPGKDYDYVLLDAFGTYIYLRLGSQLSKTYFSISIEPFTATSAGAGAVLLDPQWVDFNRALKWIRDCDTMHAICHCPLSLNDATFVQGMYLINVRQNCLIQASGAEKYVALSYVWGNQSPRFSATKSLLPALKEVDGISKSEVRNCLPATITRAICFTAMLGVDYLWVDCLCVVQDDPAHLRSQIDSMAKIFSNSVLTLCAADGADAEHGLLGIQGCSPPRNVHQDILNFRDGSKTSEWIVHTYPNIRVWSSRGWTFQEKILSRRTLTFWDNCIKWRCQVVAAEEQNVHESKIQNLSNEGIARSDTQWPFLRKWANIFLGYRNLDLTYQEDTLRAISGILKMLENGMPGGFHYGLPEAFFDAALLWIPQTCLTRRRDSETGQVIHELPSWSWAGWRGNISNQIHPFGYEHERSNVHVDDKARDAGISPLVEWFKITEDTGEKVRIANDYSLYRHGGLNGTLVLPSGWSWDREEAGGAFYYRYDRAPAGHTFWYPIPVNREPPLIDDRSWSPLLYCKTQRVSLVKKGPLLQDFEDRKSGPAFFLYNEQGEWAGILYVNREIDAKEHEEARCELILLSSGYVVEGSERPEMLLEMNLAERSTAEVYRFCHVLWIEWEGKIAYRRGLGRVTEQAWNALDKDEIEVYLG